jgi:hypothetical protein
LLYQSIDNATGIGNYQINFILIGYLESALYILAGIRKVIGRTHVINYLSLFNISPQPLLLGVIT